MSASCIPTPCIIPLRFPEFGQSKFITIETKIEILCDSVLPNIEIYYTKDGTKPQPFCGITQGNKTYKFIKPFSLPVGKITVKALALHSQFRSMCSSIVTKTFNVSPVKKQNKQKVQTSRMIDEDETNLTNTDICSDSIANITVETEVTRTSKDNAELKVTLDEEVEKENSSVDVNSAADLYNLTQMENSTNNESIQRIPTQECILSNPSDASLCYDLEPNGNHSTIPDSMVNASVNTEHENGLGSMSCDVPLQHCLSCNKVSNILAKYCDSCGQKLHKTCSVCKERNPGVAKFCQFCGRKFDGEENEHTKEETCEKKLKSPIKEFQNIGVLAKPVLSGKTTSTESPCVITQSVQTPPFKVKKSICTKTASAATRGQGYWRQQLDYICNHLKAHSNNDFAFQKLIGSPSLGKFISADVREVDNRVTIHIVFESAKASPCK